ncbi:hypothetical protein NM208_g10048 [Fusarium decemcellulare]|uniref:Uncharacterized protein n=1 Tax=Fusarium decemcellulare TaxID=57161 RepID=A0ACC1RZT6_9HYPO|nr:hypothetical protein NM208_g10048 [Fusarium decemcellulare]
MAPIQLTAVVTPQPGKAQRFLDLFKVCAEYVQANEPQVYRYEIHEGIPELNGGKLQFVVLEGYENQEALDKHMKAPPVVALLRAIEKEKLTETQLIMTKPSSGVKARI